MNEEVNLSENKTDYSIKSKILISLIAIPFIMLTLFLLWSLELFQKDKIAYIFDSTGTISNSIATQVSINLKLSEENAKFIIDYLDSNLEWKSQALNLFSSNDSIEALAIINPDLNLAPVGKKTIYLERRKGLVKSAIELNPKLKSWLSDLDINTNFIDFNEKKDFLFFGFVKKQFKIKKNNYRNVGSHPPPFSPKIVLF